MEGVGAVVREATFRLEDGRQVRLAYPNLGSEVAYRAFLLDLASQDIEGQRLRGKLDVPGYRERLSVLEQDGVAGKYDFYGPVASQSIYGSVAGRAHLVWLLWAQALAERPDPRDPHAAARITEDAAAQVVLACRDRARRTRAEDELLAALDRLLFTPDPPTPPPAGEGENASASPSGSASSATASPPSPPSAGTESRSSTAAG